MKIISSYLIIFILFPLSLIGQFDYNEKINKDFKSTLLLHKEFVSIPNLPDDSKLMLENINWIAGKYQDIDFNTTLLESSTHPILLVEKIFAAELKTVLFYFHIDGQPVNPDSWDQEDPFTPVLKKENEEGIWVKQNWNTLDESVNDEWRIFGRAAADDKAPIIMLYTALKMLAEQKENPKFNIKIIFDPEEEYGSEALLSTLDQYKERYASDYFIVMDGPAHDSNRPTLTFGCRGIATCSITTYGAKLPQHSGHLGNYAPNPAFTLANLLSSMKDEDGRVLIKDYYKGIAFDHETYNLLNDVPYNATEFNNKLGIAEADKIGENYQESLQYPSLNIRQMGTAYQGRKLKTVIPEYAVANIDVRLTPETDGKTQLQRIKNHLIDKGYYVVDQDPTDEERLRHPKIVKFKEFRAINSYRTDPTSPFGTQVRKQLTNDMGRDPIVIRMMGGTVPIVPLIEKLDVPTLIVPMVNMDNNQHSPNENIRIGNIRQGIAICLSILKIEL